MTVPVGVIGASGLLGGELLRLLAAHSSFRVEYVGWNDGDRDSSRGRFVSEAHPNLRGIERWDGTAPLGRLKFEKVDTAEAAARCSAIFLATPPGVSAEIVPQLLEAGVDVVVDLSGAHRLRDPEVHAHHYPEATRDESAAAAAVYGLPEVNRRALGSAKLIAVPGCFAAAIELAMLPLGQLDTHGCDCFAIDAKSGSTGSGRSLRRSGTHALRSTVVSPYSPVGHRHVPEVVQTLRDCRVLRPDGAVRLGLSTYGVDLVRGLSASVYMFVDGELDPSTLRRALHRTYRHEPFVRVRSPGPTLIPLPDPKAVIGSNFCDVAAFAEPAIGQIILISALDNLMKGGAGQAIQACNIRFGVDEWAGLDVVPIYPA